MPILSNNMSTNSKITSFFQAGPRKRHCQTPAVVLKASNHPPTALPPDSTPFFTRDKSEETRVPKRRKRIMAKDGQACANDGCNDTDAGRWAWAESSRCLQRLLKVSRKKWTLAKQNQW